jgi:23S rRNA (adenine2503-C2)-methyltransferase
MTPWANVRRIDSGDANVSKYVFDNGSAVAEAVLYKYPTYEDRTVVCCSTQSGCPVGCRFCGAGDNFVRSLTTDEIVAQTTHMFDDRGIDHRRVNKLQIMFMSMGEPLLNFQAVRGAIRVLNGIYSGARLLISTSGPEVDYAPLFALSRDVPAVGLQFSVHESTDAARNALIPFKAKLSLQGIAAVGAAWKSSVGDGRRPFFNYCVHERNNTAADVERLCALFPPEIWESTLSVVCERGENVAAANARQRELVSDFMGRMLAAGYSTRMFNPAGQDDIGGGCGQLWRVQEWMRQHPELARPSVGSGRPVVHAPTEVASLQA